MPDSWAYVKVVRGMHGLPHAGSLGHNLAQEHLNKDGYFWSQIVPSLWKHKICTIQFVFEADDFSIKYIKKEDLDCALHSIEKYYKLQ